MRSTVTAVPYAATSFIMSAIWPLSKRIMSTALPPTWWHAKRSRSTASRRLSDSRIEAVERLRFACHSVGGNAILMMRFDSGQIADLMNEVAAYGTAVTIARR